MTSKPKRTPKPPALDNVSGEIEAVQKFLRELTELVREQYGELTTYRLLYGEIPYTDEGVADILKMRDAHQNAEVLWRGIVEASRDNTEPKKTRKKNATDVKGKGGSK